MKALIAKLVFKAVISTVNTLGGKYLTYDKGLAARVWLEDNVISKLERLAAKSKAITLDDGFVSFCRGVLKSGRIESATLEAEKQVVD
jgi:hypothetical protein